MKMPTEVEEDLRNYLRHTGIHGVVEILAVLSEEAALKAHVAVKSRARWLANNWTELSHELDAISQMVTQAIPKFRLR